MSTVPSVLVALDGHRGVAVVADYGLGFLFHQSFAPENSVRVGGSGSVVGPRQSVRSSGGHISDVLSCTYAGCIVGGGGDSDGLRPLIMDKWVRRGESTSGMCGCYGHG
jgi:hypothetical protein